MLSRVYIGSSWWCLVFISRCVVCGSMRLMKLMVLFIEISMLVSSE